MQRLGRHSGRIKELRRRIRRRTEGEVVVDGRRLLADVVRWEIPVLELYVAAGLAGDPEVERWAAVAGEAWQMEESLFAAVAPTKSPQGVLAVVGEPQWPPWRAATGVAVWLDAVQDPGNLGAIVRAAAGLGAAAVLLSPGCADPFAPAAVRGSAAAVLRLPVEREVTAARAADRVRTAGGEVWATGTAGVEVGRWSPATPTLLMLGAEGRGLDPATVALADGTVSIPLGRGVESLNVAVAAGILLERLRR